MHEIIGAGAAFDASPQTSVRPEAERFAEARNDEPPFIAEAVVRDGQAIDAAFVDGDPQRALARNRKVAGPDSQVARFVALGGEEEEAVRAQEDQLHAGFAVHVRDVVRRREFRERPFAVVHRRNRTVASLEVDAQRSPFVRRQIVDDHLKQILTAVAVEVGQFSGDRSAVAGNHLYREERFVGAGDRRNEQQTGGRASEPFPHAAILFRLEGSR
jgi:hypothetical protein